MLKKLLTHKSRIAFALILISMLVLIRALETILFYDPFITYFKGDFNAMPLPDYSIGKLVAGLFFRYTLNTIISLGIIYVLFKDLAMIKFTSILYAFFFVVLIIYFFSTIYFYGATANMTLFYIRRFLIQPLFVMLFIPAFYYQKLKK